MSRLKGTLVLVALVVIGAFVGLRIRRSASVEVEPYPAAQRTANPALPNTAAPGSSSAAPAAPPQSPKASLLVRIRCSGKPLGGVPFTVMQEATHQTEKFTTGPAGAHQILGLSPGVYHLGVDHPDYVPASIHRIVEPDQAHEVVIELERGGRLEGKVTDATGRPLEGTLVFLVNGQGAAGGPGLEKRTDASGEYRISSIPVGLFDVRFRHSGHRPGQRQGVAFAGKGEEFRIDMVLAEGGSITGRVVAEDGTPIPGATVIGNNEEVSTCRADEEGKFALQGLGDGPVSAFASAAGYGPVYLKNLAPGAANVEFRLSKAGEVLGRISAQPLPGQFTVRISRLEENLGRYVPFFSRSYDGSLGDDFHMRDLPAGRYRVEVEAPGFEAQDMPELQISAGQVVSGIQIRLRKTS